MSDHLRVAVIGAGNFATQAHIPGLQVHTHARVVALCARNRERVQALAGQFDIPAVFTDYQDLLTRPDIDAVTIATPDALHFEVASAALEAGKHVFCEKPLTTTAAEAQALARLVRSTGLVFMVAFTYRYTRALHALRRLVRDGALGTPFAASAELHWGGIGYPGAALAWRETDAASAAGVWGDGASHLFDAIAFALAPVQEVCAQMMIVQREPGAPQPDSVDHAACLARLRLPDRPGPAPAFADRDPGTVHAVLSVSKVDVSRKGGDSLTVTGTRGAAQIALTRGARERASVRLQDSRAWEDLPLDQDAAGDEPLALTRMMGAFVDAVRRGSLGPDDPGVEAGLHAQEALDAALHSARTDRWEHVGR